MHVIHFFFFFIYRFCLFNGVRLFVRTLFFYQLLHTFTRQIMMQKSCPKKKNIYIYFSLIFFLYVHNVCTWLGFFFYLSVCLFVCSFFLNFFSIYSMLQMFSAFLSFYLHYKITRGMIILQDLIWLGVDIQTYIKENNVP